MGVNYLLVTSHLSLCVECSFRTYHLESCRYFRATGSKTLSRLCLVVISCKNSRVIVLIIFLRNSNHCDWTRHEMNVVTCALRHSRRCFDQDLQKCLFHEPWCDGFVRREQPFSVTNEHVTRTFWTEFLNVCCFAPLIQLHMHAYCTVKHVQHCIIFAAVNISRH